MFTRIVSAPAADLRSSNWREGKKQHDIFGTGGGGFDLTPDDFTSGNDMFSFDEEKKEPARPSDNLKEIFEEEDDNNDDIYGDNNEELLKYSALAPVAKQESISRETAKRALQQPKK